MYSLGRSGIMGSAVIGLRSDGLLHGLLRAVLGQRVRELLETYEDEVGF
jgi:hypothetical protein